MRPSSAIAYKLLILFALWPLSALRGESPLMTIAEARAKLARRENEEPLRVQGTITFSNQRLGLAYIQDRSGGLGFDPRTQGDLLAKPGKKVELEGYICRRQGMIMLLKDRLQFGPPQIRFLPEDPPKVTPLNFDLDLASQMRIDGLMTRVSGVVRSISVPPSADTPMLVEISSPSGYAIARLPWREPQEVLDRWLNSPVTMNAVLVCRAEPPLLPEDADALLMVPARSYWNMKPQSLEEVFQRPPVKEASAIQVTQRANMKQRLHLVGTVTAAKMRSWVCLRTEDGSIEVSTRQMENFIPGQQLAIACWPQNEDGLMMLKDGICRTLGYEKPPQPVHLEQGFFHPGRQRELVEVTGVLYNHSLPGGPPRLTLSLPSGINCILAWETFLDAREVKPLKDGSLVQLTGLCHILHKGPESNEGTTLSILPRSLKDVQVLRGPTWWTRARLTMAIWSLLAMVGIALPGALIFRWQLWRQSRHIREIENRAATEEERLRIAREFHDSLQQQLASAALNMETLKGALQAAPEMLPRLMDDTIAMLRHCQLEARHCIWDLRSEDSVRSNLSNALKDWLKTRLPSDSFPKVELIHEGTEPALPDGIPFHLMRIAQEAINNALSHANASHIYIRLKCTHHHLDLVIEDDGDGFEAFELSQPKPGHYGLSGLRERAAKIGARVIFTTHPGEGTRVSLRLPINSHQHESCV